MHKVRAVYSVAYAARNSAFTDAQLPLSKPGTLSRMLAQEMALSRRQRKNSSHTRSSSFQFATRAARASVEERDVGRPANLVVLSEGLSNVCGGHDEVGSEEEGEQTSLRKRG